MRQAAARLAEGAARGVMVVAEGLAAEGGRGAAVVRFPRFEEMGAENSDVFDASQRGVLGAQVWIVVDMLYPPPSRVFLDKV